MEPLNPCLSKTFSDTLGDRSVAPMREETSEFSHRRHRRPLVSFCAKWDQSLYVSASCYTLRTDTALQGSLCPQGSPIQLKE